MPRTRRLARWLAPVEVDVRPIPAEGGTFDLLQSFSNQYVRIETAPIGTSGE